MKLQLDSPWIERLSRLPESGMGYQRVRVQLRDGRTVEDAIVLNGRELQVPDDGARFADDDILLIELR